MTYQTPTLPRHVKRLDSPAEFKFSGKPGTFEGYAGHAFLRAWPAPTTKTCSALHRRCTADARPHAGRFDHGSGARQVRLLAGSWGGAGQIPAKPWK